MLTRVHLFCRAGALHSKRRTCAARLFSSSSGMASPDYSAWNVEQLVAKVKALEKDLTQANERCRALAASSTALDASQNAPKQLEKARNFDPSRYSSRLIALKFAYLGHNYNGLEYAAGNITTNPTVEEVLWAALMKSRLIFPTDEEAITAGRISWEGCEYSKCGRTDKGVSAFGQVISLRVRSNRPLPGRRKNRTTEDDLESNVQGQETMSETHISEKPFDPIKDEIPYVNTLNRLLPSDIRVLAWCSDLPADFNARFSCRERRYRYFFTNPAFSPTFGSAGLSTSRTTQSSTDVSRREGWLDIEAMQDAAKRYEGLHDFRNLCKMDPSKQLTDFRRRIFHSEIRAVDHTFEPAAYINGKSFSEFASESEANGTKVLTPSGPQVYQFILHGSAFLWHQVRQMVAILFLVGQGLEKPDIVDKLMDVNNCPTKPHYEMANDAPLVLWDCIFPELDSTNSEDALEWIYAGDEAGMVGRDNRTKHGPTGLVDSLWEVWRKRKIDEVLAGSLLNMAARQGRNQDSPVTTTPKKEMRTKVFLGGDSASAKGLYVPVMQRGRAEHFEVTNAKYALKKGIVPKTEEELQELRNSRRDKRHDHLAE